MNWHELIGVMVAAILALLLLAGPLARAVTMRRPTKLLWVSGHLVEVRHCEWITRLFKPPRGAAAVTIGGVVFFSDWAMAQTPERQEQLLRHEVVHAVQQSESGVFWVPFYVAVFAVMVVFFVLAWPFVRGNPIARAYRAHPMEREAERAEHE